MKADLNALQVFDAVMAERNMTRAAMRLSMTPSAVSHAMSRLRQLVGEELFERTPYGVRPTRHAEELWARVGDAMHALQMAIGREAFDPASSAFEIRIAMNDMFMTLLAPQLYHQIARVAPNIQVTFRQRRPVEDEGRIQAGLLDFSLGAALVQSPGLNYFPVWSDRYLCVFRADHPSAHAFHQDMGEILAHTHVAVMPDGETPAAADLALRDMDLRPARTVIVGTFSCVPHMIGQSDCVALVPGTYVNHMMLRHENLSSCELPISLKPLNYFLVWHERSERNVAKRWALQRLKMFSQDSMAELLKASPRQSSM